MEPDGVWVLFNASILSVHHKPPSPLLAFCRGSVLLHRAILFERKCYLIVRHSLCSCACFSIYAILCKVGIIHRQIGQVDEAITSFTQALELDPESGLALQGAGEAYLAQV